MTDKPREVPVTLHMPPNDMGTLGGTGTIADTPETRAMLEQAAIPRCREWREANPEPIPGEPGDDPPIMLPAPYCCSAYCDRCACLRALDGAEPLLPNEWMHR